MRIRQHVDPLTDRFLSIAPPPVAIPDGVPVEVELGSAEADFLMDRARHTPAGLYVGVEIRQEKVTGANRVAADLGLSQVVSVFANINVDLRRLFPEGRVKRFFLNFPDPWFKRVQHKRRVMNAELVADIHALLAPDGEMFMNTDILIWAWMRWLSWKRRGRGL